MLKGRRIITTSCVPEAMQKNKPFFGTTLNKNTLPDELNEALSIHSQNEREYKELRDVFLGDQDVLKRTDEDRAVNNKIVINYAQSTTRDVVGYVYGRPIRYAQRKTDFREDVAKLNDYMAAENKFALDKQMADDQSICGTAYRAILPDSILKDEVGFELIYLDPGNTFVAYSKFNINRPVYAWNCTDIVENGATKYIHQVWTFNKVYTYKSDSKHSVMKEDFISEDGHILQNVPIIEYLNNQWRLGDWECAIGLMNAINNLASDSVNDVEQTILSYLALFGVDLDDDEEAIKKMKKNRVMWFKGEAGVQQDAKFLTTQLDGSSAQLLRTYLEEAYRVVVGIPDRKTRGGGGGDTGDAVKLRDGWADMEVVARNKEMFTTMAEQRLLQIALVILQPKHINKNLTIVDIDIKFSRNKTDNLQTKVQSFATLIGTKKISPVDALNIVDLTTDEIEIVLRGEQYWDEQLDKEAMRAMKSELERQKAVKSDWVAE